MAAEAAAVDAVEMLLSKSANLNAVDAVRLMN
jgi:hypothetical protein